MPIKPKVLYGFEHETTEAKIRRFLQLTPEERLKSMIEFMEFAQTVERANPRNRAQKIPPTIQRAKRRQH